MPKKKISAKGLIHQNVIFPFSVSALNAFSPPPFSAPETPAGRSGDLNRRCRCRPSPYLNNVIEQDHRFIKKRIGASLWFRSAEGALRTIDGYEAMHLIRKGQIRWAAEGRCGRATPVHSDHVWHRRLSPL
jgi:hypothetical protein